MIAFQAICDITQFRFYHAQTVCIFETSTVVNQISNLDLYTQSTMKRSFHVLLSKKGCNVVILCTIMYDAMSDSDCNWHNANVTSYENFV